MLKLDKQVRFILELRKTESFRSSGMNRSEIANFILFLGLCDAFERYERFG